METALSIISLVNDRPTDVKTEKLGLLAGVNTLYEEKTHRFIAQKSGYPYLDGQGRICIMDRISSAEIASGTVLRTPLSLDLSGNLENCTIISKGISQSWECP